MQLNEIIYKINAAILDCFNNGKYSLEIKFKENIDFDNVMNVVSFFKKDKDVLSIEYEKNRPSQNIYGNNSTIPIGYSVGEVSSTFHIKLKN